MDKLNEMCKNFINQLNTNANLFNFEKCAKNDLKDSKLEKDFFNIIDRLILKEYKDDYLQQIEKGKLFYRARIILLEDYKNTDKGIGYNQKELLGYNSEESKEPPSYRCIEQRNSKKEEVALYVADDEITACAEIKSKVRQYISVAKFELTENVQVLDFSKMEFSKSFYQYNNTYNVDVKKMLSVLESYFSRPVYEDKEYVFSQKIVEHFREKGIKGYKYRSFYSSSGYNYTFFDDEMKKFNWKESRVLINYATANLFISLDRCEKVDLSNINKIDTNVNADIKEKMWKDTIREWNSF